MKPKERVLRTIARESLDRIPLCGPEFRPEVWRGLRKFFSTDNKETIRDRLGIDTRWVGTSESESFRQRARFYSPDDSPYGLWGMGPAWGLPHLNKVMEDEWGIKRRENATGKYWHFVYHPLQDLDSVEEYEFPEIDAPGRFDDTYQMLKQWKGKYFTIGGIPGFFEWAWYLRGFNQFIRDLYTNPKFVNDLLDKLLEYNLEIGARLIELGVDSLGSGEDTASQNGLLISVEIWKKYFKPRYTELYTRLKKKGDIFIFYHSDGKIERLIPELIEAGVDILNPVQPDCMDPAQIKKDYGDKLTFDGTISVQSTLPFGTPEDVGKEVSKRIDTVGYDGGLILGPTHIVGYDVPIDNIIALYDTARKHGKHPKSF